MKKATVIVLAGQSNAVGVGHVNCLPRHFAEEKIREYAAGYDRVRIHYYSHDKKNDGFTPVRIGCTEQTKHTLGPEVGLAEWFTETHPSGELFIVKCAYGGTSMWRDWLSPSDGGDYDADAYADQVPDVVDAINHGEPLRAGWCYNELVKLTRESLEVLRDEGYDPHICGFCWMQGEADACAEETLRPYVERYHNLLTDFSTAFSGVMEGCVFADGGISEIWPLWREMNAAKAAYAAAHDGCVYVDTVANGLVTQNEPVGAPDIYHYDSDCVIKLGWLFGEALESVAFQA
jgi:hypothetical protein